MNLPLSSDSLDQLFRTARTPQTWSDTPVEEALLHRLYDLLKWGPTASNTCQARFVGCGAQRARPHCPLAMPPNRQKILAAPLTVIVANDLGFAETLPKLVAPERVVQGTLARWITERA